MAVLVPVRVVGSSEEGVLCRLGSEPRGDADVVLIPAGCITFKSEAEGTDLMLLVLDEVKVPGRLKSLIGIK